MQKLGFPSMRSLDQFKSLSRSASGGPPKTFANLKLTTVKQKEDEKLWKGLEFKFSSTKTLCYRLTETLQLVAGQVQDAEKDKDAFEGKFSASAVALDGLSQQMNDLSIKLESAEETIRTREKELEERRLEKEETDKLYRNELCRTANLVEEKGTRPPKLLGIWFVTLQVMFKSILIQSLNFLEKFDKLNSLYEACFQLVNQQRDLSANLAQRQYDQLHNRFLNITSEKYATQLVSNLQQKHDEKERSLKGKHSQELKQIQLLAENELIEKVTSMRNEHKAQLRALRLQREDEIKKLQEDLDLQKSKEEKQRALLQLQWKGMSDKTEEEQEVNSKKEYSIPSRRNPVVRRRGQRSLRRQELDEKESPVVGATQTPVSTLLKKASENMNSSSVMNISKHHKKVIRDEYEVETGNGRINQKTRSTVMFEDPRKHMRTTTPKVKSPRGVVKGSKGEGQPRASNIGDLF
ncbi:hypothetical protein ACLB2K_046511 [Fragaria x ananassa]